MIDISNNIIIIIDNENKTKELENDKNYFSLNTRTKTIVELPIADPKFENKNIIIQKQEIVKDVFCSSVIGKV